MFLYIALCLGAFISTASILYLYPQPGTKIQIKFKDQFYPLSWWNFSHFLFYAILGYFYPGRWILITIQSITWEVFEFQSTFFKGNWLDLLYNWGGYFFGILIANHDLDNHF